jgi:hypothetical protein
MYAEEEKLQTLLHEATAQAEDIRNGGLVHFEGSSHCVSATWRIECDVMRSRCNI